MEKIAVYFCDSLIIWISLYLIGRIVFEQKPVNYIKLIICMIIFPLIIASLNLLDFEIGYGIIKILTTYLLQCIFYKIIFDKSISKCMVAALLYYLCMFLSEIIIAIIASIIFLSKSLDILKNTILINALIASLGYVIVIALRKFLINFVKNTKDNKKGLLIISIIILITLALLVYKIPVNNWHLDVEFIITMLILLFFSITGLYLLKQRSDIEKTSTMYQQVVDYSKTTNKLLEDYRIVNHEHKNQLSIIRQLVNEDNTKLIEYLDSLINKKDVKKYQWISSLNNLPSEGLKGLINYKLVEMENCGISPIVSISKEVSKVNIEKLDTSYKDNLYSIAGVYLDNAIEAASKSKDKKISIDIYKEKKELVIILGNTYKGKIDLEKLDEYGYTTKGRNHGVGLYIVKKILDNSNIFSVKRNIIDNYYVQELRIDLSEISKKKKTTK